MDTTLGSMMRKLEAATFAGTQQLQPGAPVQQHHVHSSS